MKKNKVFEQLALWNPQKTEGTFVEARELGAIYTRQETVDFILDLAGYLPNLPLHKHTLLEPSFGTGDFLIRAVQRLLTSYFTTHGMETALKDLSPAVAGYEIDPTAAEQTVKGLSDVLTQFGFSADEICVLLSSWLKNEDFLLADISVRFDFVVGNPPYVRQEQIPPRLMAKYRARYETIYDRADLYIPFVERSLQILKPLGVLGYICADRWMKNKYGGPLRALVSKGFHLKYYVDMVGTDAFHSDVSAYPAIFIICRERGTKTRIAHRPKVDESVLKELSATLRGDEQVAAVPVIEMVNVVNGTEPWILDSLDQLAVVRKLEERFPLLEEVGCKVGIGVATGADKAYIAPFNSIDVEPDRKLPLVTTKDIVSGTVNWQGLGVVNPFNDDGSLVDLEKYPRLKDYLEVRRETIAARHCAKQKPKSWYRTIDKIDASLRQQKKLLIPDIKGEANVVFENGNYYPHHNLYYITSSEWDLRALQAVLLSGIARLFVGVYSTQMRGGYLRYQAQYLRRIRLPHWQEISEDTKNRLKGAIDEAPEELNKIIFELFGLTEEESAAIGGSR